MAVYLGYLTDDEINALSPSAAAASKLIKSRFSLTQIYKDHCTTLEELEVVKAENVRVKKYLEDIVKVAGHMNNLSYLYKIIEFFLGHRVKSIQNQTSA